MIHELRGPTLVSSPRPLASALAAALAFTNPAAAQPTEPTPTPATATVTGRVIAPTGAPIAGARIGVATDDPGGGGHITTSDRSGRFTVTAPIGATLTIEHDGDELAIAMVTGDALDDVVLRPLGAGAETIEVHGERPVAAPGAASLDRSELQRVPGVGGDVVQALTVMPGVINVQIPLGLTGVPIRGSSPQDSKVLVDGFEIPILFHNLGFRAVLPAETIDTVDYLPGGFDVSFGRATSGIVAVTTRAGDERRTVQGEVSLLDGGLLVQGAAGRHTRYLAGLRRSTIDLVIPSLLPPDLDFSLTQIPSYYDAQLRVDHRVDDRWRLVLSGIAATDTAELYAASTTDAATKRMFAHTAFARLTAAALYHRGRWTANLAVSGVATRYDFVQGLDQRVRATLPDVTPRVEVIRTAASAAGLTNAELRTGAEVKVGRYSADVASQMEPREGEPEGAIDPHDTSLRFRGRFWVPDAAQWVAAAANLDPKIRFTVGVRADEMARKGEVAVQPRGQLEIALSAIVTARLTSGAYVRPPEHQTELLQADVGSEHATQHVASLQLQPREGARFQASAYYTDRTHLITRELDGTLGNQGRGTTVGGELLGTYRAGPWFGWLSYGYTHSTRVDRPGEPSRLFSYDQPHSLNLAASWRHRRWQLGGRFQLYSGLPYTPAIGGVLDNDRNVYIPIYGPPNSARAPIHHQLDLRVDYGWTWGPTALTAFLDVQNAYTNDSVMGYAYSYDYTQAATVRSLPILPTVGLRGVL